jgi:alpha-1,2-mannosyltransferase
LLLTLSVAAHVVVVELGPEPFNMIDLRVYVDGAGHLTDGTLYDFSSGRSALPFTYPPFSALIFKPLYWLPWVVTRVLWQAASIAALAAMIYLTLRLIGRVGSRAQVGSGARLVSVRGIVVTGTALAMWLEPVRTTFNYGQINLFLAVLVLYGAVSTRDWIAGAGVGLAAGIKLVPAITGIYYLLQRRYAAMAWSVAFFAGTVLLMLAIIPHETWRYFTKLILDPGRTGPVYSAINQSWRGALSRLAGHDVSISWLVACVLTLALGIWAVWAALRVGDRTAALLATQFTGLLISPISWSHHWIWVLPLLVWGFFGARRRHRAVRILTVCWLVACYSFLVSVLVAVQGHAPVLSRPGWQSWLGTVYVVLGMATLAVVLLVSRRSAAAPVAAAGELRA